MPRNAAERQPAIGRARWVATLWLAISLFALAGEDRHAWPEGSAMHALYLQGERLEDIRAELGQAHAGLLDAFGDDPAAPSPLARAVANHQASWLAYVHADCELAGTLTGADGHWPVVHGLGCQIEAMADRLEVVRAATACMHGLAPEAYRFERLECLGNLVAWSQEGN